MGFTEFLTLLFIALKLFGVINWAWWLVLLPEIIAVVLYVIVLIFATSGVGRTHRRVRKHFNDFDI